MDSKKVVRITGGVLGLLASALMIISSNIMIAEFYDTFGDTSLATSIVVISYFIIVTAILSKLFSILMIAGVKAKGMAIGVILTQLVMIALEIATVVMWRDMPMAVSALDISFMILSVIGIIVAAVYMVQGRRTRVANQYN